MNIKKIIFSILISFFISSCGTSLTLKKIDDGQEKPQTTEDIDTINEPIKPYEEDTFKIKGLDGDSVDTNNDDNDTIEEEDL